MKNQAENESVRQPDTPMAAALRAYAKAKGRPQTNEDSDAPAPLEAAVTAAVEKDRIQRVPALFRRFDTQMENKLGEWVPAIPLPFFGVRRKCRCGAKFWTLDGYRGHYALKHVLDPEPAE